MTACHWLPNGAECLRRVLRAIVAARHSVRLEVYIFAADAVGVRVRDALLAAAVRGVRVRVLLDALGSSETANGFWDAFQHAGGEVRWFNPIRLRRLPVRNHRKVLVADDRVGGVGGFNIAEEYSGDGVAHGWADLGLALTGPAVRGLAGAFDRMWDAAAHREGLRSLFRRGTRQPAQVLSPDVQLLVMGPGRSPGAFQMALRQDVANAREILFAVAYFLPTRAMRHLLRDAAARGARVRVIVPAKSDVELSHRAARHLYGSLLRNGVEIHEYQPQVLHTKLYLTNDAAYVGSSNLDTRSLFINHELMLRLTPVPVVRRAWEIGETLCSRSVRVDAETWRHARGPWERVRDAVAYWILARADPYLSRWLVREPR
ncbi:MAG: phosphatidylserine/phosphatidylglycerophosphate/cardiolipin synthase family protein [Verrucomicrobiae bacterium]|nr:phosphatidylserine/phosphatidylglycerophosphate/cardiolipin synthase family protein [Verrucomicrobiae bacterium]